MQEVIEENQQRLSKQILLKYQPQSKQIKKVIEFIEKHDHFVLTTHINSDADGIGSEIGFAGLLKKLGKKVEIINNELPQSSLAFLNNFNDIQDIHNLLSLQTHEKVLEKFKNSCTVLLDNSELKRTGKVGEYVQESRCDWFTIDHHQLPNDEERFCNDSSYASTTEFVWDLFHALQVELDKEIALALYVGMVADSGNFRYSKTSSRTHWAAAELMQYSIDSEKIYRLLFESQPFDRLLLVKKIFQEAYYNKKIGLVFAEQKPSFKKDLELGDDASDGIVNYFLSVDGVNIAALASKTQEGFLKCSLRSIGDIDVAQVARKFGGGGHKNAAGLRIEKKYATAKKILLKELKNYLKSI